MFPNVKAFDMRLEKNILLFVMTLGLFKESIEDPRNINKSTKL